MDYKKILEDNRDNFDLLRYIVNECDGWDNSLEYFNAYDFDDDFFETFFEGRPEEAARAVFFGSIDNWNDEYIRFNGYGNLESLAEYRLHDELKNGADEIIERALELADHIDLDWAIEQYADNTEGVKL